MVGVKGQTSMTSASQEHLKKRCLNTNAWLFFCPSDLSSFVCTLFEKSNFCPKIQFWQNPNIFTTFSPKFFWQFFSWNQSCQQLKSPKPQHFHMFFIPKKINNFLGKSKLNFWTKNEDFEQCATLTYILWELKKIGVISIQLHINSYVYSF